MPPSVDYSLYLVIGSQDCLRFNLLDTVSAAVAGGVSVVQLREKQLGGPQLRRQALRLKELLLQSKTPLLINDDVELAAEVQADGVHLGQQDATPEEARGILGNKAIIGLSLSSSDELISLDNNVDYAGIGPIFTTQSKLDAAPPMGISGLKQIIKQLQIPAVAIGGINNKNANLCYRAGAHGVAVIADICAATNPKLAAIELRKAGQATRDNQASPTMQ